jgi:hypothetical protein
MHFNEIYDDTVSSVSQVVRQGNVDQVRRLKSFRFLLQIVIGILNSKVLVIGGNNYWIFKEQI